MTFLMGNSFRDCITDHLQSLARMVAGSCDSQRKIKEAAKAGNSVVTGTSVDGGKLNVYFKSHSKSL